MREPDDPLQLEIPSVIPQMAMRDQNQLSPIASNLDRVDHPLGAFLIRIEVFHH
jgi:hypothetical protein